jgi:hypothetical protein
MINMTHVLGKKKRQKEAATAIEEEEWGTPLTDSKVFFLFLTPPPVLHNEDLGGERG